MYRRASFLLFVLLGLTPVTGSAMQLQDPRSAAVYLQQQRPLVRACLAHSYTAASAAQLWSDADCSALLEQNSRLKQAWALVLPNGSVKGLLHIPYGLRQPTIDAYAEYKKLAQRIAGLAP